MAVCREGTVGNEKPQSDMSIVGDATLVFRVVHGLSGVRRSLAEHLLACAKA